jgi:beta-lactam-binding protein with PASTA domain
VLVAAALFAGCSNAEQATVPNLHEKSVVDAYTDLRSLGLKVAIDGPIKAGHSTSWVGGQAPEAGNEVDVGSVVTLHPTPYPMASIFRVDQPDPVVLPDLIGIRLDLAARRLDELGLLWSIESMPPLPASNAPTLLGQYEVTRMAAAPGSSYDQYSRRGNASTFRPLGLWATLADD